VSFTLAVPVLGLPLVVAVTRSLSGGFEGFWTPFLVTRRGTATFVVGPHVATEAGAGGAWTPAACAFEFNEKALIGAGVHVLRLPWKPQTETVKMHVPSATPSASQLESPSVHEIWALVAPPTCHST
jgi:hypothetical protein